jgi:outer membrane protein OmpA-like peptidoglycan-associated protein
MRWRATALERRPAQALASCALLWLGGCATTQAIVLVPDPDGRLGVVEVTTSGGTQRLTKAGDMTRVSGSSAAPSAVTTADPAYLEQTFGEVLAAEPTPPERFILYFEAGTANLVPKSRSLLSDIAASIQRRGAIAVSISGHTDATGSDQLNDKLALDRAERVRALLEAQGVAPALMSVSSHGKGNPAVPTPEGASEPRNRRVEAIVQ